MFKGMKIYTVHIKPGTTATQQQPLFVKEGFNLWAFIFTWLWALSRRLWLAAFLLFAFNLLLLFLFANHMLSIASLTAINIGFHLFVGFSGNDWRCAKLARRGYIIADIAAADTLLGAEQRYFERIMTAA